MKLVSQNRPEPIRPPRPRPTVTRFFLRQSRRLPWDRIVWCVIALVTASIAIYAVSLMRHALQAQLSQ